MTIWVVLVTNLGCIGDDLGCVGDEFGDEFGDDLVVLIMLCGSCQA